MVSKLQRKSLHSKETDQKPASDDLPNKEPSSRNSEVNKKPSKDALIEPATPANPSDWLATGYHFSLSVFCVMLLYHGNKVMTDGSAILDPNGVIPKYGGRYKFLTHINQWIQLFFFSFQFLADILPKSAFKRRLQCVCDVFFTAIAIPVALFVAFTFWGIYAVDRRLVYPERFDLVVSPILNHYWHTTIAVWVLLETIVCFHRFPTLSVAISVNIGFNACYLGWIVWVFMNTEFWVYPILEVLPQLYRLLFFAGCMLLSVGLYFMGKAICHLRWGKTVYIQSR